MAFRTWGRLLLTALGVSVLAGAGQLGVAYGFGIVRLTGAFTGTTVNQWPAQLVWVGWFAANAAVAGAVLTGRLARRDTPAAGTGRQLAIGGAAALGATAVAPLCMQPARAAELISVDPVWAVGICAILGAIIGAGAAIAVLLRPELGWNMAAVAGAVWLLALISVLPSLGTAGPLPTVRLGVLEPSWLDDDAAQRLALLLLPITALLAGAATAGLSRWRGQVPLVSGATGVAGPVLVAIAYLTAGPGDAVDRYQTTPYYGALIAVLAGALGAAAAALLRWPVRARGTDPQVVEPTTILRPLPAGPALPGARSAGAADDLDATGHPADEPTATGRTALATFAGTTTTPGRTGSGPVTTDGAVRTVPAHWDWPGTTASGQHGPAAASPLAGLDSSLGAEVSDHPLGSTAGRTLPPTDDLPTSEGGAAERTDPDTDASDRATTDPATTDRDTTGASSSDGASATGGAATTATPTPKPRRTRKAKSTPSTSDADPTPSATESASIGVKAATAPDASSSEAPDASGSEAPATPVSTGSAAPATLVSTGSEATTTSGAGEITAAGAAGKPAAGAGTGRARKATRPGSATDDARPTNPATPTGPDTPATPTASDTPTGPDSPAAAEAPAAPRAEDAPERDAVGEHGAAGREAVTAPATDATPAVASGPVRAGRRTDPTDAERFEDDSAAPLFAGEPVGDAQPDRWTPTPVAWPVTSGRTTAAQTRDARSATPDVETSSDPAEWTPRPRHRASLPDLSRASTWDAFNTSRRAGPAGAQNSPTPRKPSTDTTPTDTAPSTDTTENGTTENGTAGNGTTGNGTAEGSTASTERGGSRSAVDRAAARWRRATGTSTRTSGTPSSEAEPIPAPPVVAGQVESVPDSPANVEPTPDDEAEQPARRGRLGGLFRRNRSRADEETRPVSEAEEPLPAQDEEFVDWVAGLGKPVADNEPEQENGRRSLRSTGRHHRD
ncbi:hypothetical protein ABZS77_18360 [Micromonospora sp. NPDC005298]|uniref:hypothetical protein n=1 Tax=Micromonospora sp. NPDC005298 TaxID=3156873 RepID=UPI0033B7FDE1